MLLCCKKGTMAGKGALWWLALFVCVGLSCAIARPLHLKAATSSKDFPAQWKTTKLDHFNALDTRTFQQQYWINDLYWNKPSGPVLLYINGEGFSSSAQIDSANLKFTIFLRSRQRPSSICR